MFLLQIDTYETLYRTVSKLENSNLLQGWLQIDLRPFKHALLHTIKRWSFMFKRYLIDRVTNRYCYWVQYMCVYIYTVNYSIYCC